MNGEHCYIFGVRVCVLVDVGFDGGDVVAGVTVLHCVSSVKNMFGIGVGFGRKNEDVRALWRTMLILWGRCADDKE